MGVAFNQGTTSLTISTHPISLPEIPETTTLPFAYQLRAGCPFPQYSGEHKALDH
jgi:hypothetical protein